MLSFFLLAAFIGESQYMELPDTNLRNKLIMSYPETMKGNLLDTLKAATFSGKIELVSSNIQDLSGIEYFSNIETLDLTNNKIKSIDNIVSLKKLKHVYANDNAIDSIADLTMLVNLIDFQAMNNDLKYFPNFGNPSVLQSLYLTNNKIEDFPSFENFTGLVNLVIGNNPLRSQIDVSSCSILEQLHVHLLNIDTIFGIEKLEKLRILYAWGNKISNINGLDSLKNLERIYLRNNPISLLPYLKNKPKLSVLSVEDCKLTFEDIVPILQIQNLTTVSYSPQRELYIDNYTLRAERSLRINSPLKNTESKNNYYWSKDGIPLENKLSELAFDAIQISDAGIYTLSIKNNLAPDLTLYIQPFEITVLPCLEIEFSNIDILDENCSSGYKVDLSKSTTLGGTQPFDFKLYNAQTDKYLDGKSFEKLPAGRYEYFISDANKCEVKIPFYLDRVSGCELVFSPDGDGIADFYLFDKPGLINIYDANRNLVNSLQAPISWDGTDINGTILDAGYYIIIPNGAQPLYITLVR